MPQFRDPNEKRDFMLNTPIPRLVPKMALPSIAGMLVTSAYNLADTLFVSQLGTDATGAVGVNGSIDLIIMMAGSLLAVGAASLTSRLLGAKQDERAREVLSTCFFLALALGTLVLILGFTYQNKILLLFPIQFFFKYQQIFDSAYHRLIFATYNPVMPYRPPQKHTQQKNDTEGKYQ